MKIAIIGAGNIGSSLALGIRGKYQVVVTAKSEKTVSIMREKGFQVMKNRDAVSWADVVVLSVKPFQLRDVLRETYDLMSEKTLISVIAGVRIESLKRITGSKRVFRAMPNLGISIKKSVTALSGDEIEENVEEIFSMVGKTFWIDERSFDAWTALVGSGPGILAELIDGLMLGGVKAGLKPSVSLSALLDTLEVTLELLRKESPSSLRDKVATPGGTTIEAIYTMEYEKVKGGLIKAIYDASRRSKEISEELEMSLQH